MRSWVAGVVAALVGAALAGATAIGVVSTASGSASQPTQDVMSYGSTD